MPDRDPSTLPFESSDPAETKLWEALGDLPGNEPSPELRREFYRRLEHAGRQRWSDRMRDWLGFSGNAGWVTATACALLGFGLATALMPGREPGANRLAALEQNVNQLHRELVLNRLQADAPAVRLQGVLDAGTRLEDDPALTQALLTRAAQDRSPSVRSAAIDALGSKVANDDVSREVMQLLDNAESPIVQLALVDLLLRHGNTEQLRTLARMAAEGHLHPDLVPHVQQSLPGASA